MGDKGLGGYYRKIIGVCTYDIMTHTYSFYHHNTLHLWGIVGECGKKGGMFPLYHLSKINPTYCQIQPTPLFPYNQVFLKVNRIGIE